jgi:hypothetical protein
MKKTIKLPLKPSRQEVLTHIDKLNSRIKYLRDNYGTKMPVISEPSAEPDRQEFFLREVAWMAADFEKERK